MRNGIQFEQTTVLLSDGIPDGVVGVPGAGNVGAERELFIMKMDRKTFDEGYADMLASNPLFRTKFESQGYGKGYDLGILIGEQDRECGRCKIQVGCLLQVLHLRGIALSYPDERVLRSLSFEQLPGMSVALDAEDADDFMRSAGLPRYR